MNLYELTHNYRTLLDIAEDGEDVTDTLESLEDAIEVKAEGYSMVISSIDGNMDALKKEKKRIEGMISSLDKNKQRMKSNLHESMKAMNKTKIKTDLFTVSIRKNTAKLEITDDSLIPPYYFIAQEPKLDNASLRDALKNGDVIDGAILVQGESLNIK